MIPVNLAKMPGTVKVLFAAEQGHLGLLPLPALIDERTGHILTEWHLTEEERAALAAGGRVRLWVETGGRALQPVALEVVPVAQVLPLEAAH